MIKIFEISLYSLYLIYKNKILAYSLNYDMKSCKRHLEKIKEFHTLNGDIVKSAKLDKEFEKYILEKMEKNETPKFIYEQLDLYRYSNIYRELLKTKKGQLKTYSEIANKTKSSIWNVIRALKYNPFIILIPCHRVIREDGTLAGYTPLGIEFKRKILKKELTF